MHVFFAQFVAHTEETPKHRIYSKQVGEKTRIIYEPNAAMRTIQKNIVAFLAECAPRFTSSSSRIGGRGAVRNARCHINGRHVFKIDIKNAFPTTNIQRLVPRIASSVKRKFVDAPSEQEWWEFLVEYAVSKEGRLPHGACTSSFFFEWYCETFVDMPLRLLVAEWKSDVVYTRYVDDLVFTSDIPLGRKTKRARIRDVLKRAGFAENHAKTIYGKLREKSVSITGPRIGGESLIAVPRSWLRESEAVLYRALRGSLDVEDPHVIHGRIRYLLDVLRGKERLTSLEEKVLEQYLRYCLQLGVDVGWVYATLNRKRTVRFF